MLNYCPGCGKPVEVGDDIGADPQGFWWHDACWRAVRELYFAAERTDAPDCRLLGSERR